MEKITVESIETTWDARSRRAFINMSRIIHIAVEMLGLGTGLRWKAFAHAEEARSGLRERETPA